MRLPPQRAPRANDENVVPLINIVFLLLVFFMLAGTLEPADPFAVTPPETAAEAVELEQDLVVLVGAEGELALGGELVSRDALARRLAESRAAGPERRITVKADAMVEASVLMPVLEAIRASGVVRVTLVTVIRKAG